VSKTLLQIIQAASLEVGAPSPIVVATSTDKAVLQFLALANAVGDELTSEFEWQWQCREYTFDTVVAQQDYDLPTGYSKLIEQTQWNRTTHWAVSGPKTSQEWSFLKGGIVSTGPWPRFRVIGNKFRLDPVPTDVNTFAFEYISSYWTLASGDTLPSKAGFTADTDTCVFRDRVIIAGTKLKWLQTKGLDTTYAEREYAIEVDKQKAQDQGAPVLQLAAQPNSFLLDWRSIPESGFGV
jgi:hypothetical protein